MHKMKAEKASVPNIGKLCRKNVGKPLGTLVTVFGTLVTVFGTLVIVFGTLVIVFGTLVIVFGTLVIVFSFKRFGICLHQDSNPSFVLTKIVRIFVRTFQVKNGE